MANFNRINPRYSRKEHPLFRRWTGIRQIILNPRCDDYKPNLRCVGLDDFDEFVEFIESEIGDPPHGHWLINRIDQRRGWVKGNIRWADYPEMANNRKYNVRVTYQGRTQTLKAWSRETGIDYACLLTRYHRKWPIEDLLTWPSNSGRRHHA